MHAGSGAAGSAGTNRTAENGFVSAHAQAVRFGRLGGRAKGYILYPLHIIQTKISRASARFHRGAFFGGSHLVEAVLDVNGGQQAVSALEALIRRIPGKRRQRADRHFLLGLIARGVIYRPRGKAAHNKRHCRGVDHG